LTGFAAALFARLAQVFIGLNFGIRGGNSVPIRLASRTRIVVLFAELLINLTRKLRGPVGERK